MNVVNTSVVKKDAQALVTGKPVYTDDLAPSDCLIVKILRSPHAHAIIEDIQLDRALKSPNIACILTYKDVPNKRFTLAGQSYPEPSPYDRLILDKHVRFVGDSVAIIAGSDEKSVDKAMSLIKVTYTKLPALLDFRDAKDHKIVIHPEKDWKALCPVGADNTRNLCACGKEEHGDIDQVLKDCDYVVENIYHTKANQQAMMETFRTFTSMDYAGRLNVVTSTQVPFHVRRNLAHALDIPISKIRVIKPRTGGGFGAKQTVVCEMYPALVTLKTGKPAKIVYSRYESQICSSPRHEMEIKVRIGATKDGIIRGIDVYTLSNTGAYGEHGPTTVGLSGHKPIPLYGKADAFRFQYDVVYTNVMSAGAYRGYGATQGIFAVESAVNELADQMKLDPVKLRERNMVKEGDVMTAYYGETNTSCALDRCMAKAKKMMDWDKKYPCIDLLNGKVRSVGVAMAMQGSGISNLDVGSATIKLDDGGFYSLIIGATDVGTGCDTILAQIAAQTLDCSLENITVFGVDTDVSPYDAGAYASSGTYVTGQAVYNACEELKEKIITLGATLLHTTSDQVIFAKNQVTHSKTGACISLEDITTAALSSNTQALEVTSSHCSPVSPPPFMVGMVETEIDKETGAIEIIDYVAVVDCGTTINPNLAKVQTEGGIAQGIGMALYEDVSYNEQGRMLQNSFMQYKLPTRQDIGTIRVAFESSYEPSGPYGAKSIGEIVINTPSPAIAHAVYNATKVRITELPITPEKIILG